MYSVRLGFDAAKKRISTLQQNGHHAEALLTSVFTFEKIIHRTLKQLVVSSGFRSKDADILLKQFRGFEKQKGIWQCFDPLNRKLPEIIGNAHWQHIGKAVNMRNDLVHGKRVYSLQECNAITDSILDLLDQAVSAFSSTYGYDGWADISKRFKSKLHSDPRVKLNA